MVYRTRTKYTDKQKAELAGIPIEGLVIQRFQFGCPDPINRHPSDR
jgi:hypothetical protein